MGALSTYITQVQRLLHDPNAQFWPTSELTDYINEARSRVAQDSKCLRQLVTNITLTAGTEAYSPQVLLGVYGPQVVDVMGITIYWGNLRIKLGYLAYTQFDATYRRWQLLQMRPVCFTKMGATQIFFGPNPDQNYVTDWDIALAPSPLISDGSTETIPIPFQEPIQYFAAYKAKWKEQAQGEAAIFQKQYWATMQYCYRSFQTRTIRDPYSIGTP